MMKKKIKNKIKTLSMRIDEDLTGDSVQSDVCDGGVEVF